MATKTPTIRILKIIEGTSVDGPGLRTSIYFAGCRHRCQGCHNPQSWDEDGGIEMSITEIIDIVERNGFNVTLTGGDPLFQLPAMKELCRHLHSLHYNIWCYTGFRWEEILAMENCEEWLSYLEVVVDGRFEQALRSTDLLFRGSSNQRLINVNASLQNGQPVLYFPDKFA